MRPWEPWPARTAAALFLARLRELTAAEDAGAAEPADLTGCVPREWIVPSLAFTTDEEVVVSPGRDSCHVDIQ